MAKSADFSITVERDVPTEMRDGVLLRSDIYRPVGAAACPVLLCRTPYDKGQEAYIQITGEILQTIFPVYVPIWELDHS